MYFGLGLSCVCSLSCNRSHRAGKQAPTGTRELLAAVAFSWTRSICSRNTICSELTNQRICAACRAPASRYLGLHLIRRRVVRYAAISHQRGGTSPFSLWWSSAERERSGSGGCGDKLQIVCILSMQAIFQ
jgi:hypothetical protein